MKILLFKAVIGTCALFVVGCDATSSHHRMHNLVHRRAVRSHGHIHSRLESNLLVKRATCAFPTDDPNLVSVTPNQKNAGWAMSPDQECKPGSYCPIACKPGMVMAQWDPNSKYTYPASMNGGLYCDNDGNVKKPFPDKPNCVEGTGAVKAINQCKSKMSWCQTVLPGNEAMLIPTLVSSEATIAVPDTSYWESTAAHFYINPPGTGTEGCIWGSEAKAVGNWSPYVAGANTDNKGQTFVKIGWNPIWQGSNLAGSQPGFGVKIECPDGGCNGLPCQIDSSASSTGAVGSKLAAVGAGNAGFCVVTVSKGSTAHIVAFDGSGGNSEPEHPKQSSVTPPPPPARSSSPPSSASPPPPPPSSSSASSISSTTAVVSSTSQTPSSSSTMQSSTSEEAPSTSILLTPSSTTSSTTSSSASLVLLPGVFHENGTSYDNTTSTTSSTASIISAAPDSAQIVAVAAPKTTASKGRASRQQSGAAAGLLVAFAIAAYLL